MKLPPLNSIRAFEAASRHMSFQLAAEELSVTPSALSHQIKILEDHLQKKLFHRQNRAIVLTSAGELIRSKVSEGFQKLEEAFALLRPDVDNRTLVVSTGPAFSAKWLAPRIHYFLEENPEIDFRLSANLALVDFIADGIDIGIRFGGGNYDGLFVEKLFEEVSIPLIAPRVWESIGQETREGLFEKVSLIHDESASFLPGAKQWSNWFEAIGYDKSLADRGARFSHADHAIEAAVDGAGIILARLGLAWRDIAAGRLVAPYNVTVPVKGGFYFVCPHEKLNSNKVLAFLGWIRDEAAEQQEAMAAFMRNKKVVDISLK
jgi:LysR family glycine cleavage system transcriptional activator